MIGSSPTLLEEAFEAARAKFAAELTQDPRKAAIAYSAASLRGVQDAVAQSLNQYQTQRKGSKAHRWLEKLSQRIHFYGGIVDVYAQHHPEYVALVWGSIKFLLTVCALYSLCAFWQRTDKPRLS